MYPSTIIVFLAFAGSATIVNSAVITGTNGAGTSPAERHQVTQSQAQMVIDAAVKQAKKIGQPMNVAVVDFSGHLVAFQRMDNAWPGSIDVSMKKAKTCSLFYGFTTASLYNAAQPGAPLYGIEETNGGLIVFGGGLPIYKKGILIAAIGVSGGTVDQDVAVAQAGVSVFN
ncbi:unnamed protein product [Rotaria sp. Silwood2]|nr:unnamed protein product [Rotaria sp. Silwood2]CAF4495647.1 unnamed protein product [Rotaria sp. Silwood2]